MPDTDITSIMNKRDILKSNRSPFITPDDHNINSPAIKRLKNEFEVECRSGNSTRPLRQSGLDVFNKQSNNRSTSNEDAVLIPIVSSPITSNNTIQTANSSKVWSTPFYHTSEQMQRVVEVVNRRENISAQTELTEDDDDDDASESIGSSSSERSISTCNSQDTDNNFVKGDSESSSQSAYSYESPSSQSDRSIANSQATVSTLAVTPSSTQTIVVAMTPIDIIRVERNSSNEATPCSRGSSILDESSEDSASTKYYYSEYDESSNGEVASTVSNTYADNLGYSTRLT